MRLSPDQADVLRAYLRESGDSGRGMLAHVGSRTFNSLVAKGLLAENRAGRFQSYGHELTEFGRVVAESLAPQPQGRRGRIFLR